MGHDSYDDVKMKCRKPPREKKVNPQHSKTPVTEAFEKYAQELDFKQDKYERIVKLSRDVAIASKRVIFSLHALLRSGNFEADLAKITDTLKTVKNTFLKNIAIELADDDPYQFCRAYTAGLQEYIEAVTFYHFIVEGKLFSLEEFKKELTFQDIKEQGEPSEDKVSVLVPLLDYILGVQDLSGEIMRHCISSFGAHKMDAGYLDCDFVKHLYTGMLILNLYRSVGRGMQTKDFTKKLNVALQSLKKMEMACYATHIRGTEALDFGFNADDPSVEFENYVYGD